MEHRKLYGVVCASICPMHEDGSVDYEGVKRLTRHLADSGIQRGFFRRLTGDGIQVEIESNGVNDG